MSGSPTYAFVSLVTSDYYVPGAMVAAGALRDLHPSPPTSPEEVDPCKFHIVCLVTPETVNVQTLKLLRRAFDVVIGVEVIEEDTVEALKLLGRPDLATVLTKLHVFRLNSYRKIIYLDADVLPLLPFSHLFHITSSFAAVPDVGWPDIFNSGVLVLTPGEDKFEEIMELVRSEGSWDGGDQGVLNEWRGNDWERLSFTYNTTPTAAYTYAPAYKRFGSQIKAIHFIGPNKPWSQLPFRAPGSSSQSIISTGDTAIDPSDLQRSYSYPALLDRWFAVYDKHYRSVAPVFTTTGALMPTAAFKEKFYENAWDSDARFGLGVGVMGGSMGLDKLRQLALEGLGQTPTREEGEGVYMTLPLEGRIDLISPSRSHFPKFSPLKSIPDPATPPVAHGFPSSGTGPMLTGTYTDSSDSHEFITPLDVFPESLSALTLSDKANSRDSVVKPPPSAAPASAHWDPWKGSYPNSWDLIPGIQKYASYHRAGWSVGAQRTERDSEETLSPVKIEPGYRSWEDGVESTSRDGDDEAEDEEEVESERR